MHRKNTGFTLVELMAVISIVTAISLVVLFKYHTFEDRLSLSGATQEAVIAVRQAQTYGVSVREISKGSGNFSAGYGIYFSITDPSSYYVFVDKNSNGVYDGTTNCSTSPECVERDSIKNNVTISSLCGTNIYGTQSCPPINGTGVSIVFTRPSLDATVNFSNVLGQFIGAYRSTKITLRSQGGLTSTIDVEATGQISIQ